jgi:hypothetical protein
VVQLKGFTDIRFVNEDEFIAVYSKKGHSPGNKNTFFVYRINCNYLEKNTKILNTKASLEIFKSREKIKSIDYLKNLDQTESVFVLLFNCDLIEVKLEITNTKDQYCITRKDELIIVKGEQLNPLNRIKKKSVKKTKTIQTIEYEEDMGQVNLLLV